MGSRRSVMALLLVGALVAGAVVYANRRASERAEHARVEGEERQRRRHDRDRRARGAVRNESARVMPELLRPLALEMSRAEVVAQRSGARAAAGERVSELEWLEETLANGAKAMFGFTRAEPRLAQVQVLSALPSREAVAPHLAAMTEAYGAPSGIFDCPDTGGVPTRRFTYRREHVTVADVFLLYRDKVAVTLYIAPNAVIGQSLRRARCAPVPPARWGTFPRAQ